MFCNADYSRSRSFLRRRLGIRRRSDDIVRNRAALNELPEPLDHPLTIALAGVAGSRNVPQPLGLPWMEHAPDWRSNDGFARADLTRKP